MSIMERCEKAFARYDDVHSQIVSKREQASDELVDLGYSIAMMQAKYIMDCWKDDPGKMIAELRELIGDAKTDCYTQCHEVVESGTIEVLGEILI